jgi:hypothetical protein
MSKDLQRDAKSSVLGKIDVYDDICMYTEIMC